MFARTPRLLLRPAWRDDAELLPPLLADGAVARNTTRMPYPYGQADAEQFVTLPHDPLAPRLLVFSRTRAAPRLVGGCSLIRRDEGGVELGYWIGKAYWGLGFATEAASAVLGIARACGHKTVSAAHFVDNPASARVLRKVGFRPSGVFERRFSVARGEEVLTALFQQDEDADMRSNDDVAHEIYRDAQGCPDMAA